MQPKNTHSRTEVRTLSGIYARRWEKGEDGRKREKDDENGRYGTRI
jgi:hypothetical protein